MTESHVLPAQPQVAVPGDPPSPAAPYAPDGVTQALSAPIPARVPPLIVSPAIDSGRLPVAGPSITEAEIAAAADAAANAWFGRAGSFTRRFEQEFAERHGMRFAIAVPSCTSAIHLALAALGIGPGDEVLVPDLTWIATAAPVKYVGATPVFVDSDPADWCICPDRIVERITPRTRAIIAVDLYGNIPDLDRIRALAHARGITVIEDAAEAVGSRRNGRLAGSLADVGVFSFHGSKTLTTGEGGMLITDDEALYDRCRFLQDHGREPGDVSFANQEVGFKYRMSDVPAAIGLAQLGRLDELVARKREIFAWYESALRHVPGIQLNTAPDEVESSYWMTTLVVGPTYATGARDRLMAGLRAIGIDSRPFFPPLSTIPAFADDADAATARSTNHVARWTGPRGLNLPSALTLTRADVERVARAVERLLLEERQHG